MKLTMKDEEKITHDQVQAEIHKLTTGESSKGACIRALFAGGMSVREIADVTTIGYNHVYNVCRTEITKNGLEHDITTARDTATKKSQIAALLSEGKTVSEVSKELNCLYNQVWQVAKACGFTNKQRLAAQEGK